MPSTTIEVLHRYSRNEEEGIIEAVHEAMVEALKIPLGDRAVRLLVHEPHRFSVPDGKSDQFTLISIDLFSGRSLAAKRALYQAIVRNLAKFEIPADHIRITLRETERENWGIRGGIPASEVDLGFKVDV
ncbi:MAG: tautomerase family protein [Desulfomonile tiedjei]|nr:tautomerase family protein [Desulfomonile tiedjei]